MENGSIVVADGAMMNPFFRPTHPFECLDIKAYLWQNASDLTSLPSTMSVFAVLYSLIITLGVTGNSLVILSVMRHKSLQSVRNMFIVSLSCSDIVVSIVSGTITPIMAFNKIWLFGTALCKVVPVIQGASLCFSILTLTAISIDRFILIIYPTKRAIQKRHAYRMIALNCTIGCCISAPMFFKQELKTVGQFCGRFCYEVWDEESAGRSIYGTMVFVLQFVIPFFVITYCYLMISLKLSKGMMVKREGSCGGPSTQPTQPQNYKLTVQQSEQRRVAMKRRLRTNRMLMGMVGVFLCCWTPSVVFNVLRDCEILPPIIQAQSYLYGTITHCISMSSTVWNPVLYALLNEHFRLAFAELFHQLRHRWASGDNGHHHLMASQLSSRSHRCSRLVSNAFLLDTLGANNHGSPKANGSVRPMLSSSNEPTTTASATTPIRAISGVGSTPNKIKNGVSGVGSNRLLLSTTSFSSSESGGSGNGPSLAAQLDPAGLDQPKEPLNSSPLLLDYSNNGEAARQPQQSCDVEEECSENDDEV